LVVFGGVGFWKKNKKEIKGDGDYAIVGGWSSGDGGGVMMVEVKVVVEKNKRGGGDDGVVMVVKMVLEKVVELSPEWFVGDVMVGL